MKLRGELSQGMILAGEENGVLSLATIDQSLPNGTKSSNPDKIRDVSRVTFVKHLFLVRNLLKIPFLY